jgi:hypothetical protein
MDTQANLRGRSANPDTAKKSPDQQQMGTLWIVLIGLYLVAISVLVLYGLVKLWPHPTPSGEPRSDVPATASPAAGTAASQASPIATATPQATASPGSSPVTATAANTPAVTPSNQGSPTPTPAGKLPDPELISFFGGRFQAKIYAETRLLLLVILAGALGSLMHALRSLYWYTGNREMVPSWAAQYLLLPFTGSILAVIFYFVVRGGFFSPQASFENTSPFGFAALSALVGLFSPQATLKLKEVAETIFTKPGPGKDTAPQESASRKPSDATATAPQITGINPESGPPSGNTPLVIEGTGFATGVKVTVGSLPAEIISASSTSIQVTTPASASGAAVVDVEVANPNGQKSVSPQKYTYV